jgi:hypothetical protein
MGANGFGVRRLAAAFGKRQCQPVGTRPTGPRGQTERPASSLNSQKPPEEPQIRHAPRRILGVSFRPARARLVRMVWIIALLCMGLIGLAGYHRGPICAAFSLFGLLFGLLLARPLSPLAARLLPVLGLYHPLWQLFVPGAIAFLVVLGIFKIVGGVLHRKMTLHFKHQKDEYLFFRWERLYTRLGFCVGVLNGAIYFFLLMLPVYVAGYFITEAAGADAPAGLRLLAHLHADLHDSRLDRVVAALDPVPPAIYQAADIIDLVLHNPLLESRLAHYPALLILSRQKDIQDIASDVALQEMIQRQAKVGEILNHPKIQAFLTNPAVPGQIRGLLGGDLADLEEFLNTGKSPKFDGEKILGIWDIDVRATLTEERRRHPDLSLKQIAALRATLVPLVAGFSLVAAPDNQIILEKQNPNSALPTPVGQGTWKKTDNSYEVTLSNNSDAVPVTASDDGTLQLPMQFSKEAHILIFNKEM